MEIHFPPAFWNSMPHRVLHVSRELYWCGPIHARWMYFVERYLGHLKMLVCNKARPEGSIAEGYMYEEAIGFVIEHFRLYPQAMRVLWDMDKDDRDNSEVPDRRPRTLTWMESEILAVHKFIIEHAQILEPYLL